MLKQASLNTFLKKSYDVLYPLLKNDGEFIPATCENGVAYFFIPFRVAEDADAINKELSVENAWNYFDHLVFHEEKFKKAIEDAGLKGLYITNDVANIFQKEQSKVSKPN